MRQKSTILLGSTLGVLGLVVLITAGYFLLGFFNIAAVQDSHSGVLHGLMGTVGEQSIKRHTKEMAPPSDFGTEEANRKGILAYDSMCAMCHGAPGKDPDPIGKGLFPEPPEMSHAVEEWDSAALYWTISNGIQMTGMPGFGNTHSDEEIWNIVSFVETLPEMSAEEYEHQLMEARSEHGEHSHGEDSHNEHGEEAHEESGEDTHNEHEESKSHSH